MKTIAIVITEQSAYANVQMFDELGQPSRIQSVPLDIAPDLRERLMRKAERKLAKRIDAAKAARLADPKATIDLSKPFDGEDAETNPEPTP
jgi:hypothetical protein